MVSKKDVKRDCSCHTAGMEIMELKAEVVVEVNTNGVIYENYSVRVYLNLIVVVTVEVLNWRQNNLLTVVQQDRKVGLNNWIVAKALTSYDR